MFVVHGGHKARRTGGVEGEKLCVQRLRKAGRGRKMSMTREEAIVYFEKILAGAKQGLEKHPEVGKRVYGMRKELAEIALTALRPVSREQVERVWRGCKHCTEEWGTCDPITNRFRMPPRGGIQFCPMCGRPLTDEAVEMVMERMEGMENG